MDNCAFSENVSAESTDAIEDSSNINDSKEMEINNKTSSDPRNVSDDSAGFCNDTEKLSDGLKIIHVRTAEEDSFHLEHESRVDELKVIHVNSADAIRQAIKELLSEKETQNPNNEPATITVLGSDRPSEEVRKNQEYKPESGDQLRMSQDNTRKRKSRPSKIGPSSSKRVRHDTIEAFYVGKLSNVVQFERVTRSKSRKPQNQKALVFKNRC